MSCSCPLPLACRILRQALAPSGACGSTGMSGIKCVQGVAEVAAMGVLVRRLLARTGAKPARKSTHTCPRTELARPRSPCALVKQALDCQAAYQECAGALLWQCCCSPARPHSPDQGQARTITASDIHCRPSPSPTVNSDNMPACQGRARPRPLGSPRRPAHMQTRTEKTTKINIIARKSVGSNGREGLAAVGVRPWGSVSRSSTALQSAAAAATPLPWAPTPRSRTPNRQPQALVELLAHGANSMESEMVRVGGDSNSTCLYFSYDSVLMR